MLVDVPAGQITARLYELRIEERHRLVEFLAYLGELERRKLHLELGFGSVFVFCTDHLGLPKACAFRRMTAARLLAKYPIVGEYLADGRLCLTTLVELRDVLCEERLEEILGRAAGRTEDEVKVLVAALQPRPDPVDLLRRLPAAKAPTPLGAPAARGSGPEPGVSDVRQPTLPLVAVAATAPPPVPAVVPAPPQGRRVEIGPIAESRYLLRAAVGQELVDELQAARALLSHRVPDGDLEAVLTECVRIAVGFLSKRRRGAGKSPRARPATNGSGKADTPRPTADPVPRQLTRRSRYIPAAIREEVWKRDEGRCAFSASDGRRCASTWQLEFHHRIPFARGGPTSVEHLELRCRAHNGLAAEHDFGAAGMRKRIARGSSRSP